MTAPRDDASSTAKTIEQFDQRSDKGARAAYQELIKEYNDYRDLNKHTNTEVNEYWQALTVKLANDKILPDLALAWAGEGKATFSSDGVITKYWLNLDKRIEPTPQDGFDQLMAKTLSDNFDRLFAGASATNSSQINRILDDQLKNLASSEQHQKFEDLVAPLLKDDGRLYKSLDSVQDGKFDNEIIRDDLNRFVSDKTNSLEDIKDVRTLLEGWDNDPDIKRLHDETWTGPDMTPTALAKAGGLGGDEVKNIDHLVTAYKQSKDPSAKLINDAVESIHSASEIYYQTLGFWHLPDMTKVMDTMRDKTPEQIDAMDTLFRAKYGIGLMDRFKGNLSAQDSERMIKLVQEKKTNDVPINERIDGSQLIKDGTNLRVGQVNHLTTEDGRKYDLYIPKNARKPLPLTLAMHGATGGDSPALMEHESGMNVEAERKGMAVAYLYPAVRERSGLVGLQEQVAAWNMLGTKNLLPIDPNVDDAAYVDSVIGQITDRIPVDRDRIGIMGMSDGGRFAQDYAAARPGVIASIVSESGTWMQGEIEPTHGENVMIVHGLNDEMLPYYQGKDGNNGSGLMAWLASSWIPGTSESRPWQQEEIWRKANGADRPATVSDDGKIIISDSIGPGGEVKTYLIRNGEHAIHDYKNQGGIFKGNPDRSLDFSQIGAQWILDHPIHRNFTSNSDWFS